MEQNKLLSSFLGHFKELRIKVIKLSLFFITAFAICYLNSKTLLEIITYPLLNKVNSPTELIYTDLIEGFAVNLKLSMSCAFILTLPYMVLEIYRFISPGLHPHEKKTFIWICIFGVTLLVVALLFAYFIVFPKAWEFFLNYQTKIGSLNLKFLPGILDYVNLSLQFIFIFGLIFQLPIFLILLSINSFVSSAKLRSFRKSFIIIAFVLSAFLTPPDIFSQIALAVPMILLSEISVLIINKIEPKGLKNV